MGFDCMEMDQMVTSRVAPGMAVSGGAHMEIAVAIAGTRV